MKKIDVRLINDYINGYEIPFVEEKENDIDFMEAVLFKSKDKKLYSFSSDELKNNIEFTIFVIELFRDDIDFITGVVDKYLEKNNEGCEDNYFLLTLACKIINDENNEKYIEYKKELEFHYHVFRVQFEVARHEANIDSNSKESLKKGFFLLYERYSGNELLLNECAKMMIDELFEDKTSLEKYFHENYSSINTLREYGVKKLLIDMLNYYDYHLGYYVMGHIDLLEDKYNEISYIYNNWEKYENNLEKVKFDLIYEYTHNYLIKYKLISREEEIYYLIGQELNISNGVYKYLLQDNESIIDDEDMSILYDKKYLDFYTLRHYEHIKSYISSILFENKIDDSDNTSNNCTVYEIKRGNNHEI